MWYVPNWRKSSCTNTKNVTRMPAARALRGLKLKSLMLICRRRCIPAEIDVLEVRKHVSHLGWKPTKEDRAREGGVSSGE